MKKKLVEQIKQSTACSFCGALPGERCLWVLELHSERVDAYRVTAPPTHDQLNWFVRALQRFFEREESWQQEHRSYIASAEWEQRRKKYYASHRKQCAACNAISDVQLHHLSYESLKHFRVLGKEPDRDLPPLCGFCHQEVHRKAKHGPSLRNVTLEFVKEHRKKG